VFNAAYIVSTCGKKMDKVDYVFDVVQDVTRVDPPSSNDTLESYYELLRTFDGLGSFLTGQVIADLKNTSGCPLAKADDWWTWCAPGPGSLRGINWLQPTIPKIFNEVCQRLYAAIRSKLDTPKLCMQDFQNCLCEFDKWKRTKDGTGKPKQFYTPIG
jgi:hypothetical protein